MIVGIDASNLKSGGGLTHLIELLSAAEVESLGIAKVIVWAHQPTLVALPERPWLTKMLLRPRGGAAGRLYWQLVGAAAEARRSRCAVLFIPGGSYIGRFRPFVTMSRNMLPFDKGEMARYPIDLIRARLWLLRRVQGFTFRQANGLIFLTQFARDSVLGAIGRVKGGMATIPHGVNPSFKNEGRKFRRIEECSPANPFRIVYVSHIGRYKHQWHVIEAVSKVRAETNWPIAVDFIGGSPLIRYLDRFEQERKRHDPKGLWCIYHGPKQHRELPEYLAGADMAVFASSCENMPNTLIEKMAAGLPIASSNRGPMPECLAGAGKMFDPEDPADIALAVKELVGDASVRREFSRKAVERAAEFSWERCSEATFSFVARVASSSRP